MEDLITKYNLLEQKGRYLFYYEDMRDIIPSLVSVLSLEEQEKFESIEHRRGASYFLFRRGMLRVVLSQYTLQKPEDICILRNEFKKPYLRDKKVAFNLSHSRDYLFIGISENEEIGVDVESTQAFGRRKSSPLVDIFSKEELARYRALENCENAEYHQEEFFRNVWVRKEAVVKALGIGITVNLCDFTVMSSANRQETKVHVFDKEIKLYSEWSKNYYLATALFI